MQLDAKVALITGASSGIGKEFAIQLHQFGMKVVLVARRRDLLENLANELEKIRSNSTKVLVADLSSEDTQAGFPVVRDYILGNSIDLLVNNAGRGSFGYFDQLTLTNEEALVNLNVISTLRLAHLVIPKLKAKKSGGIIGVSSVAGFQALPFMATYSATKAFNLFHSLSLWYELKEFNVHVLTVCPGPVATEFGGVARLPGTLTGGRRTSAEAVVKESLKAFLAKKVVVVPGYRAKLLAGLVALVPRVFSTALVGKLLKGIQAKVAENSKT